jgi:hypothetical protein
VLQRLVQPLQLELDRARVGLTGHSQAGWIAPISAELGRNLTAVSFPNANHALVETTTRLTMEMLRSDTSAPGLFAAVAPWLRVHGLGT